MKRFHSEAKCLNNNETKNNQKLRAVLENPEKE